MQQLQPNSLLQGGRYKIINTLGQGGFGITYLAIETYSGKEVAIKEFFFKNACGRDESTSRVFVPLEQNEEQVATLKRKFAKEAKTLESFSNQHIVRVYDTFEENNTSYYVMDYVQGESLEAVIRNRKALPESVALDYIRQTGDALSYIHNKKVSHLDIKPENIMLRNDGTIILIDFGISKHYDDKGKQTSTMDGAAFTKGYASPEQMNGAVKEFSPVTDVYSLGATLYALLMGQKTQDPYVIKCHGLGLRPSFVSNNTWVAIECALKYDIQDRPQSMYDFIGMLDGRGYASGETTVISDDGTLYIGEDSTPVANFNYPLSIPVNKKIYTECQLWTVKSIELQRVRTLVKMTVQSLDEATTAWSGTGKIRTDEGDVYLQKDTSLPKRMDESFVISPWQKIEVEDVYPAIPTSVTGFNVLNDNVILKGIEITNGRVTVPDANGEEFLDITKAEYIAKKNGTHRPKRQERTSSDSEKSEFSVRGMLYILFIIGVIILVIKILMS